MDGGKMSKYYSNSSGQLYVDPIFINHTGIFEISKEVFDERVKALNVITQAELNTPHLIYLAETDWYVTRKAETGKNIPNKVKVLRESARLAIL